MQLMAELLELEEGFWKQGESFYRRRLAEEALLVMPEPVGVLDKHQTVESIAGGARWATVRFENPRLLQLGEAAWALIYEARAYREREAAPYRTMVSSVYVRSEDGWQLTLHQQSPPMSAPERESGDAGG